MAKILVEEERRRDDDEAFHARTLWDQTRDLLQLALV